MISGRDAQRWEPEAPAEKKGTVKAIKRKGGNYVRIGVFQRVHGPNRDRKLLRNRRRLNDGRMVNGNGYMWTDPEKAEAVKLLYKGKSNEEIGDAIGRSRQAVARFLTSWAREYGRDVKEIRKKGKGKGNV